MIEKAEKQDVRINLNCYTIRFRKKNNTEEYLSINEVFGNKSFTIIMNEFVKTIDTQAFYLNDAANRILYLERSLTLSNQTYSGIIRKGYSSHETYIDDVKSRKVQTINKVQADQFSSTPFYFNLTMPSSDSKCFIFIAQSYKQYGFKEVFEDAFLNYFESSYSKDFYCEFGTLSIASLFDKYIADGNIKKLRFRKHTLSKNLENILGEEDSKEKANYEMELSVIARKKGFMGVKKKISFKDSSFIETFKIDNFEFDEIFADVTLGGRKRVLNITKPSDFSASYDITDKAKLSASTNHPDFTSVDNEATSIIKEEIIPNLKA